MKQQKFLGIILVFCVLVPFAGCATAPTFDGSIHIDVVITSRSHGSFRLVPVMEDDTLIDRATLDAKIRQGIADYEAGKVYRMNDGESTEDFLGRMISEK